MDHLAPVLIQLRERDASRLKITEDAIHGSIRFGVRPGRTLQYWVVLVLDATMKDGGLAGTYTWTMTRAAADHADTGEVVLTHSGTLSGQVTTAAELQKQNGIADDQEYLSWRGDGSGCTKPGDAEFTEDAAQVRMRWVSEDDLAGGIYGGNALYSGGYHPPVLSAGRIYATYFRPTVDPNTTAMKMAANRFFDCAPDQAERYKARDADEVIVCIDAATGVTLWKRAFIKDSENMAPMTKYGPWMPPCIDDGRVFAEGCNGHVYCLDKITGEVLWRAEKENAKGAAMTAALQVGDGVVVNSAGIGLDVGTGQRVWGPAPLVPGGSRGNGMPGRLKWVHEGVSYFVSSLGCVRARDGKECWKVSFPEPMPNPREAGKKLRVVASPFPVLKDDILVIPGVSRFWYGKAHGVTPVPTRCFRMYPDHIEELWDLAPDDLPLTWDHAPIIYDGHVYFYTQAKCYQPDASGKKANAGWHIVCVNLATGKITSISETTATPSNFNHLFAEGDFAYIGTEVARCYRLDPAGVRTLWGGVRDGKQVFSQMPFPDGYFYPILLDGRLFRRLVDGFIVCDDFRERSDMRDYYSAYHVLAAILYLSILKTAASGPGRMVQRWQR